MNEQKQKNMAKKPLIKRELREDLLFEITSYAIKTPKISKTI